MGIFELTLPGFAIKPRISATADRLDPETPWYAQALCLFAYDRRLMVDHPSRLLTLVVRRWWLLREVTVLPFTHIEYLWYGFGELPITFGYTMQGAKAINSVDWFNVALKVRGDSRPLLLFRFLGLGSIASEGLATAFHASLLLWILNLTGAEENQSRGFVHSLQRLLDVPVSSPMEQGVRRAVASTAHCPHCGHALAVSAQHCVYCGATFSAALTGNE